MNKVLIIDASESDGRIMSGLLTRAGYDPVVTESIEAGKVEAAKLPPGAVIVSAMRLSDGTAREFINWLKKENYGFPVIAIENCTPKVSQKTFGVQLIWNRFGMFLGNQKWATNSSTILFCSDIEGTISLW